MEVRQIVPACHEHEAWEHLGGCWTYHWRQHNLASVIDPISRNGHPFCDRCHDGGCKTLHNICTIFRGKLGKMTWDLNWQEISQKLNFETINSHVFASSSYRAQSSKPNSPRQWIIFRVNASSRHLKKKSVYGATVVADFM